MEALASAVFCMVFVVVAMTLIQVIFYYTCGPPIDTTVLHEPPKPENRSLPPEESLNQLTRQVASLSGEVNRLEHATRDSDEMLFGDGW